MTTWMKSRVSPSTQQNRSLRLVQGITHLNYLIIPNHLQKEPSNTFRLGMFGKKLYFFFFLKYDELLCDYSLLKSSLCDHPRKEYGSWDGGHVGHISLAHGFHAVMRPLPLASQDALGHSSHNKGSESITL